MHFDLKYGSGVLPVDVPDGNLAGVLRPRDVPAVADDRAEIDRALSDPISSPPLRDLVRPGDRVIIAASDVTRPAPSARMIPPLLSQLNAAGVPDDHITVVFGRGIHRRQTPDEQARLVGPEVYRRVRCIDSDPDDYVDLGTTSRGTPVRVFREAAEADFRIATGNLEYHYFVGYSGGAKAYMPGLCHRTTIEANHSMMTLPGAAAGHLADNPVRQDLEEAGEIIGVGFALNTVLNAKREIVKAFAGAPRRVVEVGAQWIDEVNGVSIEGPADIVVASAGGYPKDIDMYQAQKAVDNARFAVRPGGTIVLAAECRDGFGEATFEDWMLHAATPSDLVDRIKRGFVLGGHKAAALAMAMEHARILLVSAFADGLARRMFFEPVPSLQAGLAQALDRLGSGSRVLLMPNAGSTLPIVRTLQRRT